MNKDEILQHHLDRFLYNHRFIVTMNHWRSICGIFNYWFKHWIKAFFSILRFLSILIDALEKSTYVWYHFKRLETGYNLLKSNKITISTKELLSHYCCLPCNHGWSTQFYLKKNWDRKLWLYISDPFKLSIRRWIQSMLDSNILQWYDFLSDVDASSVWQRSQF